MSNAIELLKEVVREQGEDFVYELPNGDGTCLYEFDGKASCGVGKVMEKMGVPASTLAEWDTRPVNMARELYEAGHFPEGITPYEAEVLDRFQKEQDRGMRYGEALEEALEA